MWKIVLVLILTALVMLAALYAYEAPATARQFGLFAASTPASLEPPLMYAGIRG